MTSEQTLPNLDTLTFTQQQLAAQLLDATVTTITAAPHVPHHHCTAARTCTPAGPLCALCALDEAVMYRAVANSRPQRSRHGNSRPTAHQQQRAIDVTTAGTYCAQLIRTTLADRTWLLNDIREVLLDLAHKIRMGGNRL